MSKVHVSAVVNGDPVDFLADPRESLLDCLRDKLALDRDGEGRYFIKSGPIKSGPAGSQ